MEIRDRIHDPISAESVFYSFGIDPEWDNGVTVFMRDLRNNRGKRFLDLIQEELNRAKKVGVTVSSRISFGKDESGRDVFRHELAHVNKVIELGIDLKDCGLAATFLESAGEVDLILNTVVGSISREERVMIALAPEKLSDPDKNVVISVVKKGELPKEELEEIRRLYLAKTGEPLRY